MAPRLSLLVVVHRIPRQARNTLRSLSPGYQRGVTPGDYEIVVAENASDATLGEAAAREAAGGASVTYIARNEPGVSPVPALNDAFAASRGETVALAIDGARMFTPRLVEQILVARRLYDAPLVVAPGYHLGPKPQYLSAREGYDEATEQALLERARWEENGYALFDHACFDDTNDSGLLNPYLESTCLACPRTCFEAIGGADPGFVSPGGGIVNLDLLARLSALPGTRLVTLAGEGAFHQFHGGTSSAGHADREARLAGFRAEYERLRGRPYATVDREPLLLGPMPKEAHRFLERSAELGRMRAAMVREKGLPLWDDGGLRPGAGQSWRTQ
ncbi:MAG: glycosyltransferase [Deltaproteobacteria bacterium]|nr:glycosyltransferase [Deltaproteobacteria bacterium]